MNLSLGHNSFTSSSNGANKLPKIFYGLLSAAQMANQEFNSFAIYDPKSNDVVVGGDAWENLREKAKSECDFSFSTCCGFRLNIFHAAGSR
jgi:hypothetical protein